jgi:hypothetical protein
MFANGCELLPEETHYRMVLVAQQCRLIPANFIYSGILTLLYFKDDRAINT